MPRTPPEAPKSAIQGNDVSVSVGCKEAALPVVATSYSALLYHYCTLKDNRGSLELLHPILSVLSPAILCISEEYASPSEFLVAATLNKKSLRKEMRF